MSVIARLLRPLDALAFTICAAFLALAGCATPQQKPQTDALQAVLLPGAVLAEHLAYFAAELEKAGFKIVESRGYHAPVVRIIAKEIEATRGGCKVRGTLFVGDSVVELDRAYGWPADGYAGSGESAITQLPEAAQRRVYQTCLASFARTVELALRTPAAPS